MITICLPNEQCWNSEIIHSHTSQKQASSVPTIKDWFYWSQFILSSFPSIPPKFHHSTAQWGQFTVANYQPIISQCTSHLGYERKMEQLWWTFGVAGARRQQLTLILENLSLTWLVQVVAFSSVALLISTFEVLSMIGSLRKRYYILCCLFDYSWSIYIHVDCEMFCARFGKGPQLYHHRSWSFLLESNKII